MLAPTRTRRFFPSISRTMLGEMATFLTSGFFSAFGDGAAARAAGGDESAGPKSQPAMEQAPPAPLLLAARPALLPALLVDRHLVALLDADLLGHADLDLLLDRAGDALGHRIGHLDPDGVGHHLADLVRHLLADRAA